MAYRTSEPHRLRAKLRRDAIKAAGGEVYEALLAKERAQRAKFRTENRERYIALRRKYEKARHRPFKAHLCRRARIRGRELRIDATITPTDLIWPTHCPVLGIELDYPERAGERKDAVKPNWPSLDRWDPKKGYVPGNVFVISFRANTLKNNASHDESLKIAAYLQKHPMG